MKPSTDLNSAAIQVQLQTNRLGKEGLLVVEQTGSTNADLLAAANRGASEGVVLVADHQTAGRGRKTRTWHGSAGEDLMFSVLLRPRVALPILPSLVLAAGLAMHEAISQLVDQATGLKWPNDILIDGRKVCGILCQTELGDSPSVIVGCGVNVNGLNEDLPPEIRLSATTLRSVTQKRHDRGALLAECLASLERWYDRWQVDPPAVFAAWESVAGIRDRRVHVTDEDQSFEARALGLDETGNLLVEVGNGRRTVAAGDLNLLEE